MPRKLFKRYLPKHTHFKAHPNLRFLGPLLEDPNLFHLNRYSVSMAFLVGMFLAFFPLPGQMLIAGFIAFWVRCNLPIAVLLVWITNPITIPPIFFMTYKLGTWILDSPPLLYNGAISWQWLNAELGRIWKPLLVGSLAAGSFVSVLSYFIVRTLWRSYVLYQWYHRQEQRTRKKQREHRGQS